MNLISESYQICNGYDASRPYYPYTTQALLNIQKRSHDSYCTGTMISLTHVLTAAHCVSDRDIRRIIIEYGSFDRVTKQVEARLPVHIYQGSRGSVDIAIVEAVYEFQIPMENIAHDRRWPREITSVEDYYPPSMCGWGPDNDYPYPPGNASRRLSCLTFGELDYRCNTYDGSV